MIFLNNCYIENCYSCSACELICPTNCIHMVEDFEGFKFPKINKEKCINCNLCVNVCQDVKDNISFDNRVSDSYVCIHKDENILLNSSSGGAFYGLIQATYNKNPVFYGAYLNSEFLLKHASSTKDNAFKMFKKSKYFQSDLGNIYCDVKNKLLNKNFVIFTGTPCQIAGLKLFLQKEYENLLTIDIICHGVASNKAFLRYKDYLEKKYKAKLEYAEFRYKTKNYGKWNSKQLLIKINSKEKILNYNNCEYLRAYDNGLLLKKSCSNCMYAQKKRISDITLGDAWGIEKKDNSLDVHKGVSCVLFNTKKGIKYKSRLEEYCNITPIDYELLIKNNYCLRNKPKKHKNRDDFYINIDKYNFKKNVNMYIYNPSKAKIFLSKIKKFK